MNRSRTLPKAIEVAIEVAPGERTREPPWRQEAGSYAPLLSLLAWRSDADHRSARAAVERAHLESVAGRLTSRLPPPVLLELEALPDDAYLTFVRSPDVFHAAFHGPKHQLAASVQRWLDVERARPGAATRLDGDVRAASCDRTVRARAGEVLAIDLLPRLDVGGPGPGPALDDRGDLPERLRARPPERLLAPLAPDELAAARHKLEGAWQLLREASPLALRLVSDMIQVVCVRSALDDPRGSSASDPTTLGVVHLSNAHLPHTQLCEVASALLREATHQALHRWELCWPLLSDRHVAAAKVRSPWTGEVVDVYGLLLACFARYGEANLWRLASAPDELAVLRQRRAAEAGFAERPLDRLGRHRHALSAELQAALEGMTAEIAA